MNRSVLSAAVALALLAGCGFHLRGTALGANFDTAYVSASRGVSIAGELERTLGFSGVQVIDDRDAADVVIELTGQRQERRSVSVTERARTAEYELSLEVRYRIVKGGEADATQANVLVADRSVRVVRSYRLDRANIVSNAEEEGLLRSEMEQDLVQQIIRSLDAATRHSEA